MSAKQVKGTPRGWDSTNYATVRVKVSLGSGRSFQIFFAISKGEEHFSTTWGMHYNKKQTFQHYLFPDLQLRDIKLNGHFSGKKKTKLVMAMTYVKLLLRSSRTRYHRHLSCTSSFCGYERFTKCTAYMQRTSKHWFCPLYTCKPTTLFSVVLPVFHFHIAVH